MQMYQYKNIIGELSLHMVVYIGALIVFLYIFMAFADKLTSARMSGAPNKDIFRLSMVVLSLLLVIIGIMRSNGLKYFQVMSDYYFSTYETYEGEIVDTTFSVNLNNTKIEIDDNKYYLWRKDEQELRNHIGSTCRIIYGSRSGFIFEYNILEIGRVE